MVYWIVGQPGHGKTTIGKIIHERINESFPTIHVDGDDIREIFNNKDYSETGRRKNIELAQNIVHFLHLKEFHVIVSLVSPYLDQREQFKEKLGDGIIEIYVHTDEIRGREKFHVENYQKPIENFLDLDTTNITPDECVDKIFNYEYKKLRSES